MMELAALGYAENRCGSIRHIGFNDLGDQH
jgi:hypothetical protein